MNSKRANLNLYILLTAIIFSFLLNAKVYAAVNDITVKNNDELTFILNAGDTGKIIPDMTTVNNSEQYYYEDEDGQNINPQYNIYYDSDEPDILTIDNIGNYQAIHPGTVTVNITVYSKLNYYSVKVFSANITFTVNMDMTDVTLSTDSVIAYMFPSYYSAKNQPQYNGASAKILINSPQPISYVDDNAFSFTCNNSKLGISAYIEDNYIYIEQSKNKQGKATITVTIYGKTFIINYEARKIGISDQSYLLVKKKKYKMTVTGYEGDVTWKSSNPKIATVNSKGVITGKKIGNCIITAQLEGQYLGCAVSVTTAKLKKVTERATYIGTHWKYSQPKRASKGYYDCSALVWKAYKEKAHVTFGSSSYPGTTATESAWCKKHGKMIKGGMTYKKFLQMTVNPGDIMFKSNNMKKKYSTTYHVEMFTGYICNYVDSDGKAYINPLWAARGSYYGWEDGSLLARPMK